METVTLSRAVDAPPAEVRALVGETERFMRSAGFDDVSVEGSQLTITNSLGLATIELDCELVEADCLLAYEQREGIFESMETRYTLSERAETTEIEATTAFSVDVSFVGELLDATVVKRQRTRELRSQFDYLEQATSQDAADG
jgi:hypothetical protein